MTLMEFNDKSTCIHTERMRSGLDVEIRTLPDGSEYVCLCEGEGGYIQVYKVTPEALVPANGYDDITF